jgi:hypothetical protein
MSRTSSRPWPDNRLDCPRQRSLRCCRGGPCDISGSFYILFGLSYVGRRSGRREHNQNSEASCRATDTSSLYSTRLQSPQQFWRRACPRRRGSPSGLMLDRGFSLACSIACSRSVTVFEF